MKKKITTEERRSIHYSETKKVTRTNRNLKENDPKGRNERLGLFKLNGMNKWECSSY